MRNPEYTRKTLIDESANLFNTQGYKATSLSDITRLTGYTKGAIYRHFKNKGELEKHAFRRLSEIMMNEITLAIKRSHDFGSKCEAIFGFFENYHNAPIYQGGCPLLNAAVEADDSNPELGLEVRAVLARLRAAVRRLIENGIKNHQVRKDVDADRYATVLIASLEGGIMMSRLEEDPGRLFQVIDHLRDIVKEMKIQEGTTTPSNRTE